jgi:hypothetical protein
MQWKARIRGVYSATTLLRDKLPTRKKFNWSVVVNMDRHIVLGMDFQTVATLGATSLWLILIATCMLSHDITLTIIKI